MSQAKVKGRDKKASKPRKPPKGQRGEFPVGIATNSSDGTEFVRVKIGSETARKTRAAPKPGGRYNMRYETIEEAIRDILAAMGDDPTRPGLRETPTRVAKAWLECWGVGYGPDEPTDLVKLFDEPGISNTQMVTVKDIVLHSHCEHHMAPFFGVAHIAYVPRGGVIGLSKLARVVEHYSRRLQVQERLTNEISDFLTKYLSPDVAIVLEATHMCMVSRGVMQPNAKTVTSALRGAFYDDASTRQEFYRAIGR